MSLMRPQNSRGKESSEREDDEFRLPSGMLTRARSIVVTNTLVSPAQSSGREDNEFRFEHLEHLYHLDIQGCMHEDAQQDIDYS